MAGKITLTTFGIGAYGLQSGKIHWMALGCQQWGYNTQSEDYNVKVTLPIAYAIKHYIVVSNAEDKYAGDVYVTGSYKLTLTNFMLSKTESTQPVFWISLGIQQWGVDYGRANAKQINYPIAFAKFVKVVALDGFNSQRINCYSSLYEEPSLTYFKFNYDSETRFVNWIAVGY